MTPRNPWIQSAAYDLPLIALAPLIGLGICLAASVFGEQALMSGYIVEAGFFLFGMPHYLSTYSFFLDDANRSHYAARKVAFVIGPALIILVLVGATALHFYIFVAIAVDVWNAVHVSRQSNGIMSIYRHRSGGNHPEERVPANFLLVGSALGMYLLSFAKQPLSDPRAFGSNSRLIAVWIGAILLTACAAALFRLLQSMMRRKAQGAEWTFLFSSLLLFTPYLILQNVTLAGSALLIGHYVQYLSLLWLINRRKYVRRDGSLPQRALVTLSRSGPMLLGTLAALALIPFALDRLVHNYQWNLVHMLTLNAVVLLHFYFDGLVWAFRDPYVRQTLAPFVLSGPLPAPDAPGYAAPAQVA